MSIDQAWSAATNSVGAVWGIIQHVGYDGRGGIEPALRRAGLEAVDCRPFAGEQLPVVSELSGLIVLGAPDGSADADAPEHLVRERQLIREAVGRGLPVLGVCFGSQLLAVALGGSVVRGGPLEIGMGSATLTDTGRADPVLGTDGKTVGVLHWHRDAYTLPPGAVRLATSGQHVEQAFRFGEKVYGLQFHVEINAQLASVVAEQMPAGSLPGDAVSEAASWGEGLLDRFLALG
jgi:GMP synthase-like glutamine amidotransferase